MSDGGWHTDERQAVQESGIFGNIQRFASPDPDNGFCMSRKTEGRTGNTLQTVVQHIAVVQHFKPGLFLQRFHNLRLAQMANTIAEEEHEA
ncbi:hypothetical protein D3C71_1257310 [compost metagenome]